jgi:hypothetical protein
MSTENSNPATLTADDIAALKTADRVCFYLTEGRFYIRAILEHGFAESPRIFSAREQRLFPMADRSDREREIDVTGSVYGYDQVYETNKARAFDMIHGRGNALWHTAVSLMTVGAGLSLQWCGGNDSENLREAGLHKDELQIKIKGKRTHTLAISTSVCADNSARMVRSW